MVHKHRSSYKSTVAKDVSPMRNMYVNKHSFGSSPADHRNSFGLTARLAVPTTTAQVPAAADKWKYNNMVTNDRNQFNNMHFC